MEVFEHREWLNRQRIGKFYHRSPNGENWCDVLLRLRDLERDIVADFVGERLLVVCHHTVVQCTRVMREGLSEQEILAVRQVPNCSITSHVLDSDAGPMRRYRLDYAYKVIPVDERDEQALDSDSEH
jgi:broad specificity phosphatase PhoE